MKKRKHSNHSIYAIIKVGSKYPKLKKKKSLPLIEYKCMTNHWFQGYLNADLPYQTLMFSKTPPMGYIKHLSIINYIYN